MAGIGPFVWGQGGQALSPTEVARQRAVAQALAQANTSTPKDLGEGLNAIGRALAFNAISSKASEAEKLGREAFSSQLAQLGEDPDRNQLIALLDNQWASPGGSAVAQSLLQQELAPPDPMADIQLEQARLDLEQDRNAQPERKYEKDQYGVQRYIDTGEPVFEAPAGMEEVDPGYDPSKAFDYETSLSKEYRTAEPVSTYQEVRNGYERLRESAKLKTGQGDMGLIYGYMKMLDPGSVVRESEFATAAASGSFGEQIQGLVTKLINGEKLPDSVRQGFIENAKGLYAASSENLAGFNEQFSPRLGRYKVKPENILVNPEKYDDEEEEEPFRPTGIPGVTLRKTGR